MTIKYIPEGDKFRASQLWGEGRHQLSILKNLMSFGDLQQDQRTVPFGNDGTIIKCDYISQKNIVKLIEYLQKNYPKTIKLKDYSFYLG